MSNYLKQAQRSAEMMRDFPIPGKADGCTCSTDQPFAYEGTYICAAGCPIHDPGNAYAGLPSTFR